MKVTVNGQTNYCSIERIIGMYYCNDEKQMDK